MSLSPYTRHHSDDVDRKYRAKVVVFLMVGCLSLWAAVGFLAANSL